ncbi:MULTISPECIES: DUF1640 domain-containing protein [unclassified Thiocapsa]|uniref:DUF1640 domain-containing protein n=1 Tax=unclassified Thiocapsa TaxID=2641286 RepID=UPI0035B26912
MTAITFDTLKLAKKLEAAGFSAAQAEAVADAFREATSEELVSRDFLDARLVAAKADLIKWLAGLLLAQAALIAALVKLL